MLIDPSAAEKARQVFRQMLPAVQSTFGNETVRNGLQGIATMVESGKTYDAMRAIRHLFPAEAAVLGTSETAAAA
jgi:flagellar protein FlbT